MQAKIKQFVESKQFEWAIVVVIVINAILLGLETSQGLMANYSEQMMLANDIILWIFVVEILLKWVAVAPRIHTYFTNGWNVFDFTIVALSFVPNGGSWVAIARMARLLRVLRLITAVPRLRFIVKTLLSSVPSMLNVVLLMAAIFYVYAIIGYHMFYQHDPEHWGNLPLALLTLFRIVTLEDWTDVMYTAMEISPYMSFYFVSFVIIGTFVFINLFVAVMLKNADKIDSDIKDEAVEAKQELDDILAEVRELKMLILQNQKDQKEV